MCCIVWVYFVYYVCSMYNIMWVMWVMQVQCAAKVRQTYAWLASGDSRTAQISIVECVTPTPLILECFKVCDSVTGAS